MNSLQKIYVCLMIAPEPLRARTDYQIWVASVIILELLARPLRSHLKPRGRIIPDVFADGLVMAGWPSRRSFYALPNRKSILVGGAHNWGFSRTLAHFTTTVLPSLPTTDDLLNLTLIPGLSHCSTQTIPRHARSILPPFLSFWSYRNARVNTAALEFFLSR